MKNIIVIPTFYRQAEFFLRMEDSLETLGFKMIFCVYKLSLYFLIKNSKSDVQLIKSEKKGFYGNKVVVNKCVEYNTKQLSYEQCDRIYAAMYRKLNDIIKAHNIDMIFIWNGSNIDGIAGKIFAQNYNIKTLFFEIANLPGKIFIDKEGTNAQSLLYKNKNIMNKCYSNNDFAIWRKIYLSQKYNKHIVPQKKSILKNFQCRYLIDILGAVFFTKINNRSFVKNKILQLINNMLHPLKFDTYDFKNREYIFLPLQVSYDSQIILNGNVGYTEIFNIALEKAILNKCDLLIKPHPQECNYAALEKFLKHKKKFFLVNDNTFLLMKYAKETVTINSTTGLEALILGTNVDIKGRALYESFDRMDLAKYIMGYLVNIDFFGKEKISVEQVKKIMERIN